MTKRRILSLLILLLGIGVDCVAVERASYTVELSEAPYEIRRYDASVVAVVHVDGTRSEAVNQGFRILAGYIFGGNQGHEKIAMTAPVTQSVGALATTPAAEAKAASGGGWTVRFTMPAAQSMRTLPAPTDHRVLLVESPPHRTAAMRFSGFWSDANLASHEAQLLTWVRARGLGATSPPTYAYYDPPWTPWFMRTIEVLVDLAEPTA